MKFNLHEDIDESADSESAFADDVDVYMETDCQALTFTKNILDDFYHVSSLQINAEKTKLCVVGREAPPDFIELGNNLGFSFVNEFKMLGIIFDKDLNLMDRNITKCIQKMNNIRNFFAFFKLTIPG